jgi:hypothetical protein
MYKLKHVIHVSWISMGISTFITVIFCVIFSLLAIVIMEVCTVAGDVLTDAK